MNTPAEQSSVNSALTRFAPFLRDDLTDDQRTLAGEALAVMLGCGYETILEEVNQAVGCSAKRLLEVGCGTCWHAPLFLEAGAISYTGVDQYKDPQSDQIFDRKFAGELESSTTNRTMPVPFQTYIGYFKDCDVISADILNYESTVPFNASFLLTVTEHLEDPRAVFQKIHTLTADNGVVYFSHQNYYCWNGHHLPPRKVADYDQNNLSMKAVADWAHVINPISNVSAEDEYLNRIRPHELIGMLKEMYTIVDCHIEHSTLEEGGSRLTSTIRTKLIDYYEEELLANMVYCIMRKLPGDGRPEIIEDQQHRVAIDICWSNPEVENCFITRVPALGNLSDLGLFEDGRPLGPANAQHADIRKLGRGQYSIWGNFLYFSTSDNSDPATNGRTYTLKHTNQEYERVTEN